ncbi:factor H binding protein domain-containing protein [Spirabiliibacterium falconis]|uniref:factor H binding protein domain-containing protein n=1 Tax=Spirabiliibacterium falconis TaxID=572023 RepID=UPI001AAC53DE|nr:factor H binding protein domain-containing protein [Spirabiliibacterium falconis]MBE2895138.1 hypothetical protein [Spirabiliibacterium falconis]
MFNLPKKTALCILVALGATGCLSTNNDQAPEKQPINTAQQESKEKGKQADTNDNANAKEESAVNPDVSKPTTDVSTEVDNTKKDDNVSDASEDSAANDNTDTSLNTGDTSANDNTHDTTDNNADSPAPTVEPVVEKTEDDITREKVAAFTQRNYQESAKSLQAQNYDGEPRYYSADVNVEMGDGTSINVEKEKGFVNLPLGDFMLPTHGRGNYRKTEYGYNNVYSTIFFSDFDARTAASVYGTRLNELNELPQDGVAKYYGKFKGANALNGNVVLNANFADKTLDGKIIELKDANASIPDIILEKASIKSVTDPWSFDDASEVVFEGKATGGKSEWQDISYKGHFYGPTGEEAAAKLSTEVEKDYNGYKYKENTAIGVFTTTRDE